MSINSVLNRGLDGLTVNMRGMAVTANNIANVNTKGYARQDISIGARETMGADASQLGGAEVIGVSSIVDPFVEAQLFNTSNQFGLADGRNQTVGQLESIWNDSQTHGLGKALNDFFSSFSELHANPSNISVRQTVKEAGVTLSGEMNSLYKQFNDMRQSLSSEISTRVGTINNLATQIANLNKSIASAEDKSTKDDLGAQRTDVLRQLSEEANVTYYTNQSDDSLQVQIGGGMLLVSQYQAGTLSLTDDLGYGGKSTIDLQPAGAPSTSVDVTGFMTSGRLGGNLTDRNGTLNDQITNIDQLAYQISTQVNALHTTGYGLDGSTGNNFFAPLGASATSAAQKMAVDASIISDPKKIAAATQDPTTSGVSDNRMALKLSDLSTAKSMTSGTQSFGQYYQTLVGGVGVTAQEVTKDFDTQTSLLNRVQIQRESISGVNMDEEGANLIRFQKAFQGASRLISIANDMMDSLLKI